MFDRIAGFFIIGFLMTAIALGGLYYFGPTGPNRPTVETYLGPDSQIIDWQGCGRRLNGDVACNLSYQTLASDAGGQPGFHLTARTTLLFAYKDGRTEFSGWDLIGRDFDSATVSD